MKNISEKEILIVDDEEEMRAALSAALEREGYKTTAVDTGTAALEILNDREFDVVLSDVKMPKMTGPELLREVKKRKPHIEVIMMTAYGTIDNAVESMKAGAFDYLLKPFSADILTATVNRVFQTGPKKSPQPAALLQNEKKKFQERQILTKNKKLLELLKFVDNIAYSKSTVLITGETGTGKEMVARYIHQKIPRADKPFLAVNCAAMPEGLLETELFGHEKGAFTGAISRKEGKFELAHTGTLLLDEVTEMTPPLQAKLLRVLQEHEIDRVGGKQAVPVDVRIIATTNKDSKKLIAENKFREDLYYRLNVIPLKLPPLRERKEDIPLLAKHFLKKHCAINHKSISGISADTLSLLQKYEWRGNVRELENIIERSVLICQEESLLPAHLFMDDELPTGHHSKLNTNANFKGTIYEMEKDLIFQTLAEVNDNKTRAAEALGISIRTLRNKLNEYKEK
ncbi:MAG: sigma-54-dependent Fis family transcriptional regulator [Nitrospinae bacterium]|nr:sigma-54-dependent Fis family transcriptional regulator [Nitrospinota bacterium]